MIDQNSAYFYYPIFADLDRSCEQRIKSFFIVNFGSLDSDTIIPKVLAVTYGKCPNEDDDDEEEMVYCFAENNSLFRTTQCNLFLLRQLCGQGIRQVVRGDRTLLVLTNNGHIWSWEMNPFHEQINNNQQQRQDSDNNDEEDYYHDSSDEIRRFPKFTKLNNRIQMNLVKKRNLEDLKKNPWFVMISCGYNHSLALTYSGRVYSWGLNSFGQCGTESGDILQSVPTRIESLVEWKVTSIAAAANHSIALTDQGLVFVWGNQLNIRKSVNVFNYVIHKVPVRLESVPYCTTISGSSSSSSSPNTIRSIATGLEFYLLLSEDGILYCYSRHNPHCIAINNQSFSRCTVRFKEIAAFDRLAIAKSECGHCYVWGNLAYESNTVLEPRLTPNSVLSIDDAIGIYSELRRTPHLIKLFQRDLCSFNGNYGNYHRYSNNSSQVTPTSTPKNSLTDNDDSDNDGDGDGEDYDIIRPKLYTRLAGRFSKLFDQPIGSDLKFVWLPSPPDADKDLIEKCPCATTQNYRLRTINVHRTFLQIISPHYFRPILSQNPNTTSITITRFPYPIYYCYLRYLYTDHFDINRSSSVIYPVDLLQFSIEIGHNDGGGASGRFRQKCLEKIFNDNYVDDFISISIENCCLLFLWIFYQWGIDNSDNGNGSKEDRKFIEKIRNAIIKFIRKNFNEIIKSPFFVQLDTEESNEILELGTPKQQSQQSQ